MANTKTAKENILITERNRKRNLHFKSKMKSEIKVTLTAIQENAKNCQEVLKSTLKTIDKTASKGIIHPGTASRKKSNLVTVYNQSLKAIKEKPAAAPKAEKTAVKPAAKAATKTAAKATKTEKKKAPAKATEAKAKATTESKEKKPKAAAKKA
ncbi:MAG: small subunit ribosomal protein S20 [Candidatus Marinamargulisbacteria bacterium]|jgi:small subunit ribosomal protein S20